jgi:3'-phosphoadenosine 5'-phosphosulfate sulfotransferase (PAPS reductase)/FAD synthetase
MKILIFYSGGKDSQASLIWAVKKYGAINCEAVFCDTGWENPVTYDHIVTTCNDLNVKLNIIKSNKYDGMLDLAKKKKRFPSTKARFCTEELKIKPSIDYILSHNEHLIIIEGIRKNESLSRSRMEAQCTYFKYYFEPYGHDKKGKPKFHTYRKKEIIEWTKQWNADKIRPIFEWSTIQTLDFIKDNRQLPNPLYYQGFSRVGCFPCIQARHGEVKLIIENHPEQWQNLKDAEAKVGCTFFPPDYIPKYAQYGKGFTTAPDVERYFNDKNATLDMFADEIPSCMSVYNLCE